MKRTLYLILALTLCLSLASCSSENTGEDRSLYDEGIRMIGQIDDMAESEGYTAIFTGNGEVGDVVKKVASGSYDSPLAVYSIKNVDKSMMAQVTATEGIELSEEIKEILRKKILPVLPSQINALSGVTNLAASNMLTHGDIIKNSLSEPLIYLYIYDGDVSFMVSFMPYGDDILSINANALINENFKTLTELEDTESFFKEGLGLSEVEIEKIR